MQGVVRWVSERVSAFSTDFSSSRSNSEVTTRTSDIDGMAEIEALSDAMSLEDPLDRWIPLELSGTKSKQDDDQRQSEAQALSSATVDSLELITPLGVGGFGNVQLCSVKGAKAACAVKILSKSKLLESAQLENVKAERRILAENCDHPFVVKLFCTFTDSNYIYMLQEYVPGGDMFLHLQILKRYSKETAVIYAAQIVHVLDHLHSNCVAYRDLKPENVLITATGYLKLADFGHAVNYTPGCDNLQSEYGTAEYLAPEIIHGEGYHSYEVDWWALGILIYEMLVGHTPFAGANTQETYQRVLANQIEFPECLDHVSRDLILHLLNPNASQRLGCWEAESHGRAPGKEVQASMIFRHWFFLGLDVRALYQQQLPAPLMPNLESPFDTKYFQAYGFGEDETQLPECKPLTPEQHALFQDFE